MRSVESILKDSVALPYQHIWIKYLEMTPTRPKKEAKSIDPTDMFLDKYQYSTPSSKDLKNGIQNARSSEDISVVCDLLYNLRNLPILDMLVFCQTAASILDSGFPTQNRQSINIVAFHTIISISIHLKSQISKVIHKNSPSNSDFNRDEWLLLHEPLSLLLSSNNDIVLHDLSIILQPYLQSFDVFRDVFSLEENSSLVMSTLNLAGILIKGLNVLVVQKNSDVILFLSNLFFSYFVIHNSIEMKNPFVQNFYNYLNAVIPIEKRFPENAQRKLTLVASRMMSMNEIPPEIAISCMKTITASGFGFDRGLTFVIVKCMIGLAKIKTQQNADLLVAKDKPEPPANSIFVEPCSYFAKHPLLSPFAQAPEPLQETVLVMRDFIKAAASNNDFMLGLSRLLREMETDEYIRVASLVAMTLPANLSDGLNRIAKSLLRNDILNSKELNEKEVFYRDSVLNYLFNASLQSKQACTVVLNAIAATGAGVHQCLRLLRSLTVVTDSPFIQSLVDSDLIPVFKTLYSSNDADDIAQFMSVVGVLDPNSCFRSKKTAELIYTFLITERFDYLFVPLFQMTPATHESFPHMLEIINRVFQKPGPQHLCVGLLQVMRSSIPITTHTEIKMFIEKTFPSMAILPMLTKDITVLRECILVILTLEKHFPSESRCVFDMDGPFIAIVKSLHNFKSEKPIIDSLLTLALAKTVTLADKVEDTIYTITPLKAALEFAKDSEIEGPIFEFVANLCERNTSNAFECFVADLIPMALHRISSNAIDSVIRFFMAVGKQFFSPLCLHETLNAIKSHVGDDLVPQQKLLDAIAKMSLQSIKAPVDSFFHFNGESTGIFYPGDISTFSNGFTFATVLKTDKPRMTVFKIAQGNSDIIVKFEPLILTVSKGSFEAQFLVKILEREWHELFVVFSKTEVSVYCDGLKMGSSALNFKLDFGPAMTQIAPNSPCEIGPTFFFTTDNIEIARKKFIQACNTHHKSKISHIALFPDKVNNSEIEDACNGETASFKGLAVPLCMTISDVLQLAGSFNRILPLFEMVIDPERNISWEFLHWTMVLLESMLRLSEEMEENFLKAGGFQLLSGFLMLMNTNCFTLDIMKDLVLMFSEMKSMEGKKQASDFIWLNFNLVMRAPFIFQKKFYESAIIEALQHGRHSFEHESYGFLIHQLQLSRSELIEQNKKVTYAPITQEEEDTLKLMQWNFFVKFMSDNFIPDSDIEIIGNIFVSTKSIPIQLGAGKALKLSFVKNPIHAKRIIDEIGLSTFLNLLKSNDLSIQKITLDILEIIDGITYADMIIPEDFIRANIDEITNEAFLKAYGAEELTDTFFNTTNEITKTYMLELFMRLYPKSSKPSPEKYFLKLMATAEFRPSYVLQLLQRPNWMETIYLYLSSFMDEKDINDRGAKFVSYIIVYSLIKVSPALFNNLVVYLSSLSHTVARDNFITELLRDCVQKNTEISKVKPVLTLAIGVFLFSSVPNLESNEKTKKGFTVNEMEPMTWLPSKEGNERLGLAIIDTIERYYRTVTSAKIEITKDFSIPVCTAALYVCNIIPSLYSRCLQFYKGYCKQTSEDTSLVFLECAYERLLKQELKPEPIGFECDPKKAAMCVRLFEDKLSQQCHSIDAFFSSSLETLEMLINAQTVIESFDIEPTKKYISFKKLAGESNSLMSLHNTKLALAFANEYNTKEDQKWRTTCRVDSELQNCHMVVNHNFDDHMDASKRRDDARYVPEMDSEQPMPFKRILEQNLNFSRSIPKKMESKASFPATYVTLKARYKGTLHTAQTKFFFEGEEISDGLCTPVDTSNRAPESKFVEFEIDQLEFVFWRTSFYSRTAAEAFMISGKSYFFVFDTTEFRNSFLQTISKLYKNENRSHFDDNSIDIFEILRKTCKSVVQTMPPLELLEKSGITKLWQSRKISNFKYLMSLNVIAGRSLNDISQYPIFPWVLKDYESKTIDLHDPKVYRDLTKPMGTMNESRLVTLQNMRQEFCSDPSEDCLYRVHYSNAASVIGFLIRTEPFSTMHVSLQGGRYDYADRLFMSVPSAWESCVGNTPDYRELIPEFYCSPYFLSNENKYNLGVTISGDKVDDVTLPKWAKSPFHFVSVMREALESELVSSNVNSWIDLIFGINQRSEKDLNLFHPNSYEETFLEAPEEMKALIQSHAANFGSCPTKIFNSLHPKRSPESVPKNVLLNFNVNSRVLFVDCGCVGFANSIRNEKGITIKVSTDLSKFSLFKYNPRHGMLFAVSASCYVFNDEGKEIGRLSHKGGSITCVSTVGNLVATGGTDCSILVHRLPSLEPVTTVVDHETPIQSVAMNPTLGLMVSAALDGTVSVISLVTGRTIAKGALSDSKELSALSLCVSDRGVIAVSALISRKPFIVFMDLRAKVINVTPISQMACRLFWCESYFVACTSAQVTFIDCGTLSVIKTVQSKAGHCSCLVGNAVLGRHEDGCISCIQP